jgi:hypothetical protein
MEMAGGGVFGWAGSFKRVVNTKHEMLLSSCRAGGGDGIRVCVGTPINPNKNKSKSKIKAKER